MLSKLAQTKDPVQQSKLLNEIIDQASKNSSKFVAELTDDLVSKFSQILHKQNFHLWVELSVILLSIQECFQYADVNNKATGPALRLVDLVGAIQGVQDRHQKINKLEGKYPTMEISIVLLAFYAKYCVIGVKQQQLPRVMPIFIRMSSFIIEKYLQLRNQPAKGTEDRIEDDKVILKYCQKWVAGCIELFFKNAVVPQQTQTKQLVLMAVCDIIGALLQTSRQNVLQKQLTTKLLQKVLLQYLKKFTTLQQIVLTLKKCLSSKHFNNPLKKIQIPQIYSDYTMLSVGINTQACCYVVVRMIRDWPALAVVLSQEKLLGAFVPVVSQILSRPYQIKIQAIHILERVLASMGKVQINTGFQYGYPIQLALFYFWQYQHEKYQSISSKFVFNSKQTQLQSLLSLNGIYLQNLQKQKQKYIISTISSKSLLSPRTFLALTPINFNQQKVKRQLFILDLVEKLNEKYKNQVSKLCRKWSNEVGQGNFDEKVQQKIKKLLQ